MRRLCRKAANLADSDDRVESGNGNGDRDRATIIASHGFGICNRESVPALGRIYPCTVVALCHCRRRCRSYRSGQSSFWEQQEVLFELRPFSRFLEFSSGQYRIGSNSYSSPPCVNWVDRPFSSLLSLSGQIRGIAQGVSKSLRANKPTTGLPPDCESALPPAWIFTILDVEDRVLAPGPHCEFQRSFPCLSAFTRSPDSPCWWAAARPRASTASSARSPSRLPRRKALKCSASRTATSGS